MEGDYKFMATLDIGTTKIKSLILNKNLQIMGSAYANVNLLYPGDGAVEIDPNELWETIKSVIKNAITDAKLSSGNISSLGISTQRSTFITWRKDTGEPFHNFITWKDLRCAKIVKNLNQALTTKLLRFMSLILHSITRRKKFLLGSKFKLECNHVTPRLLWAIQNYPLLEREIKKNNVMLGTLDTWLLYKLTNGTTYVTDISNASATGFYDPFDLEWSTIIEKLFNVPLNILPPVVSNDYDFGKTDVFGSPIKILNSIADQSASTFGSACLKLNDLKITLGTGAFLDVNTWDSIQTNLDGMYPLIGWKIKEKITYLSEAPCNDAGSLIEWMKYAGYIKDISHLNTILNETKDSEGVFFVPAFSGLGPPINDPNAGSGFIGITPKTTMNHMVLAVIESLVFRITLAFQALKTETHTRYQKICIDGGVAQSDFICQMLADINKMDVERAEFQEIGALGLAFLALIQEGIYTVDELHKFRKVDKVFNCNYTNFIQYEIKLKNWREAANRFLSWK